MTSPDDFTFKPCVACGQLHRGLSARIACLEDAYVKLKDNGQSERMNRIDAHVKAFYAYPRTSQGQANEKAKKA